MGTLIKRSVTAWSNDYAPSMGAALSYYSVFSMAPLLLLVISIAGLIFGQDAARGQLFATLTGSMGADAAKTLQDMLAAMSKPSHGITGTAINVGILVVGATTVFGELQDALDRIWRAPDRVKTGGMWGLLRSRVLSFGMILGVAFLLMVSLVATAAVSALGKWWGGFFGDWEVLLHVVNLLVGFLITAIGFSLIYKFMPRVRVQWHDVWWGAAITSLLFTLGKFLIGLYIGKTGVASGFGAAGSIAVIFVWVYYSAQIFLLGAEFTWIYAQMFGSRRHADDAVRAPQAPQRSSGLDAASLASSPPIPAAAVAVLSGAASAKSAMAPEPVALAGKVPELGDPQLDKARLAKWVLGMGAALLLPHVVPKLMTYLARVAFKSAVGSKRRKQADGSCARRNRARTTAPNRRRVLSTAQDASGRLPARRA